MPKSSCKLCADQGWFFYTNKRRQRVEIRRCNLCEKFDTDIVAGITAKEDIVYKINVASVITEVRKKDDWMTETMPCFQCMKKGWYIELDDKRRLFYILHCDNCKIVKSDLLAGDVAVSEINSAFQLYEFAERIRGVDRLVKKQTAKAFGEVLHQWMAEELYKDKEK